MLVGVSALNQREDTWYKVCFRSHTFLKYTVYYIHHLVIHDVLYSVRHLMNGWDLKYTISQVHLNAASQLANVHKITHLRTVSVLQGDQCWKVDGQD